VESSLPPLGEGCARLLEAAWQLYTEHGIQMENSRLGGWSATIEPALEACRSLPDLQLKPVADAWTTQSAFSHYARG